eukprot:TRINITY_DN5362_c0_g1_i1.p2 TRINITY_DN5362_c0_g1~~TRINITY_DN5362_c0_g1_i1.p2  ORF type:complete len:138 (-),score=25.64 TRINITY_DN5362_c0_g1_i1:846-1259(-)
MVITTPRKIPSLINVVAVACGNVHSMALTGDGDVYTWGASFHGQLGHGAHVTYRETSIPTKLASLSRVVLIAAGGSHSMAVTSPCELYAWGLGYYGALGNGSKKDQYAPVHVEDLSGYFITALSLGDNHSMVLTGKF